MKRTKKCKGCGQYFTPYNSMEKACSVRCALTVGKTELKRKERKAARDAKERLKTRSQWLKEAQAEFNRWVRLRDHGKPCISCGRHHQGQNHAGHYRTVGGNPELRFEPLNVHLQCAPCNNHKSGDIVNYRINLVERIGQDRVDWLEGKHESKKYTIDQIKAIKATYRQLANEIQKRIDGG